MATKIQTYAEAEEIVMEPVRVRERADWGVLGKAKKFAGYAGILVLGIMLGSMGYISDNAKLEAKVEVLEMQLEVAE